MSAIDRLRVRLARIEVDPYIAKRGEKIVPVVRYFRSMDLQAVQLPGQAQLKGLGKPGPKPKPRTKNAPEIADTDPASLLQTIATGEHRFMARDKELGGGLEPPPPFPVSRLEAGAVKEQERAQSTLAINKFMKNKAMKPFFDKFGRPTFVIANGTPEDQNPLHVEDPAGRGESAAMAAWRAGVVYVYAPTTGDPKFLKQQGVPVRGKKPEPSTGPSTFAPMGGEIDTVMEWGGRDAILRHEYGHQVMFLAFDQDRQDGESDAFGGKGGAAVLDGFFQAIFGKSQDDFQAEVDKQSPEETNQGLLPDDLAQSLEAALGPLSTYAFTAGVHEAAAEAFAVVTDPHYSRKTSPYPPATQKVLDYVEDLVK